MGRGGRKGAGRAGAPACSEAQGRESCGPGLRRRGEPAGQASGERLLRRTCGSVPVGGGGLLSETRSPKREPSRVLEGAWSLGWGSGDTTQSTNVRVCGVAAARGVTLDGPLISEHVCKMGVTVFEFVGIM